MVRALSYPPDLTTYVVEHWPEGQVLRLSRDHLAEALSVAFQASMMFEEGRTTRFRLLLTPPEELPEEGVPNEGVLRLRFDRSRPLTADELRRLSPSAPFETTLIGASVEDGKLRIWGLAHSGPAWLAPAWGGRSVVPNWTYDPIVHVTAPGHVAVRCAGALVGALERGQLVDAAMDVFDSEWLPALFAGEREQIRDAHVSNSPLGASPTSVEHSLIGTVGQHMLRRAIQLVRGARHGGMVLFVEDPELPSLHLKYRFAGDEPARRYRTLLFELLDRLSASTAKTSVSWLDFASDESPGLEKLEHAIFEVSRVIASIAATDGAVVLDKRLELIGFGAEVSAELPAPTRVWRALDVEGARRECELVEAVGTRHRAAYRFVRDHPRGLAIVISHDGAVRFVANRDGDVVFWEQSVSP
ncbi:hypothetical protein L6R52_19310 [Myxococcota bacterium]|nr:hypothetical protein [Myxococcota bacterium]